MPLFCGCCPAWAEGCLSGELFFSSFLFTPSLYCVCCPARAAGRLPGAGHGVRGAAAPLHPLHPRTPRFSVLRKASLKLGCTPPAACRVGVGADLPGRSVRVMSAPAAALRPPFGRTGSPSRPRHRCICGGAEGVPLPAVSRNGKIDGRGCAGRRQKGKIQRERAPAKGAWPWRGNRSGEWLA